MCGMPSSQRHHWHLLWLIIALPDFDLRASRQKPHIPAAGASSTVLAASLSYSIPTLCIAIVPDKVLHAWLSSLIRWLQHMQSGRLQGFEHMRHWQLGHC